MNILRLIVKDLRKGTASYKLPHAHECLNNQYRGLVQNDAERCIGCGACAYVCPTAAIEVKRCGDNYSWAYDPGKCTFCGRCIERCRPNTLSMESKLPPLYEKEGGLRQILNMVRKRSVKPATPAVRPTTPPAASGPAAAAPAQVAVPTPEFAEPKENV